MSVLTEHHHRDGLSWKHVADNHLSDDVQASLLIGHGLNDACHVVWSAQQISPKETSSEILTDWQDEEGTDTDANNVRPPREMSGP